MPSGMSFFADRREGYFVSRDGKVKKFDFNLRKCVLESYSVPIPVQFEKVIYDTGIQKRGLTVFLGERGRIIHG